MIITSTFFQPEGCLPNTSVKEKKKVTLEKKLTKSQTGRRGRQNLIKFNKAERIAQALNSNPAFFPPFTTSAYLNTFTAPPFICVCIRWRGGGGGLGGHWGRCLFHFFLLFLFECWPRMDTICANCLSLCLSCMPRTMNIRQSTGQK